MSTVMTTGSALALGLVICLHLPTLPTFGLFDWGVPWFFFASGYWFLTTQRNRECNEGFAKLRERARSLLVPYFLWNLAWFPILFVFNWLGWRYCGAPRVIDASCPCVLRCLGLNPFAWPALVPTWFLRALFVVTAVVGSAWWAQGKGRVRGKLVGLALFFWTVHLTRGTWCPSGPLWNGFFSFGLSLQGCAWFATGMLLGMERPSAAPSSSVWVRRVRRQLMPVYILHAPVIVSVGWAAKALGVFDRLATPAGDVAMWFIGITGAVTLGEILRRKAPKVARVAFGSR